jgi:hypothetical protein
MDTTETLSHLVSNYAIFTEINTHIFLLDNSACWALVQNVYNLFPLPLSIKIVIDGTFAF